MPSGPPPWGGEPSRGCSPHRLLQQLLQRVDPLPVASFTLDDNAVAEGGTGHGNRSMR